MSGSRRRTSHGQCFHCGLPLTEWDAHDDGQGYRVEPTQPAAPPRRARRLAWIVIASMLLALGGLGIQAAYAPIAEAAGSTWYLHGAGGPFMPTNIDNSTPTNAGCCFGNGFGSVGTTYVWPSSFTVSAQTLPASAAGSYTFDYWLNACVGSCTTTISMTFGYSADAACSSITTIVNWSDTFTPANAAIVHATSTNPSAVALVSIPANSYMCWQMVATAKGSKTMDLYYDSSQTPTFVNTPTITVPELGLALLGLALVVPLVARRRLANSPA